MLKKYRKGIALVTTLTLAVAIYYYTQPFKELSTNVANGEIKYTQYCLACHGLKGYGDGPLAAALVVKPNDINKKFKTTWKPDNRLSRRILVGKPKTGMPGFREALGETDAEDILAYIRTLE